MKRLVGLAGLVILLLAQTDCAGGAGFGPLPRVTGAPSTPIKHIVIIVQENRSPDDLFHGLPGAYIASTGKDSQGHTLVLQPVALAANIFLSHTHDSFVKGYDGGKMDGFD